MKKVLPVFLAMAMILSMFANIGSIAFAELTPDEVVQIEGGMAHTLMLESDGTIWSWGYNHYGQLGNGTTVDSLVPMQITALKDKQIVKISTKAYHNLALCSDGTVWSWGDNREGQLGIGTIENQTLPVQVPGISEIVDISAGLNHSVAVAADGTVWSWGSNKYGQLGDGTQIDQLLPKEIGALYDMAFVSAGIYHTIALKSDGTVWSWGYNTDGQLGDGTTTMRLSPVKISGLSNVESISVGGHHALAVDSEGTIWSWGKGGGVGSSLDQLTPIELTTISDVKTISAGIDYSMALKTDGTVWGWGVNSAGQLGDGTTTDKVNPPVQVGTVSDVSEIHVCSRHSFVVRGNNSWWAWGSNSAGQLGTGTTGTQTLPVKVNLPEVVNAQVNLSSSIVNGQIVLSWELDDVENTYNIYRATSSGGTYEQIASEISVNTYTDATAINGVTYYYVMTGVNDFSESGYSNEVTGTVALAPDSVSDLSVNAGSNNAVLSWGSVEGATGYHIYRSTVSGSSYARLSSNITGTTYTDSTLDNGATYYYAITAVNDYGESSYSNEVSEILALAPKPLTSVSALADTDSVNLSWMGADGTDSYSIYRAVYSGGPYVEIGATITENGFEDTNVINGTAYYYVVKGVNIYGESSYSNEVNGVVALAPTAVANIEAESSTDHVTLYWDLVAGAKKYNVYRSAESEGNYVKIASNVTTETYTDYSPVNGITYYYVLTAVNDYGESSYSDEVYSTVEQAPEMPNQLIASSSDSTIHLSWDAVAGGLSYNVYRSTELNGTYTKIGSNIETTAYSDHNASAGTIYYYTVAAVNYYGESTYASVASCVVPISVDAPALLSAVIGADVINLSWSEASGADSYTIYRGTTSGTYDKLAVEITNTNYLDSNIEKGTAYYYVVTGVNVYGEGASSNEVTGLAIIPAETPTNLIASAGTDQIDLSWNAVNGTVAYNVYRSTTSAAAYVKVAEELTSNRYEDTQAVAGVPYYYVVTAENIYEESGYSNEVQGLLPQLADVPAALTATADSDRILLLWHSADHADYYNVYRATTSAAIYVSVATHLETNFYEDRTAEAGITYYYAVTGNNAFGESNYSDAAVAEIEASEVPMAPSGLLVVPGDHQATLSWNAAAGATGYNVYRATTTTAYTVLASNVNVNTYVDQSAENGTVYYYAITAMNDAGESGYSTAVSAMPIGTADSEGNRALVTIGIVNGGEKEFDLSVAEIELFLQWYDSTASGSGIGYYVFDKTYNLGPFTSRQEYVIFDKILYFEIDYYES
jgi:alpha-tubulin suppressor-like RCC1 family protein/fibronectin type 3 domain-containing protein